MRIAVHTAWHPEQAVAEAEIYQRMSLAATRLGWTCCRTNNTREIEAFAPDVVLAEHFFLPKLVAFPTLGLMWNPPAFWNGREDYIKNVISYDGHLFADQPTRQFVRDLVSPLATRFVEGEWLPTCQATPLVNGEREGLAYFQTGWDAGRHHSALLQMARSGQIHLYGPNHRRLPFDGLSVLQTLTGHAAALCLHSAEHRKLGTPSARIFEAAAAGAVIISDQNDFVRETFGNTALYLNMNGPPEGVAAQVLQHLSWVENNPVEATKLRSKAHRIFCERFTFESLLAKLPDLVADIRSAWRAPGAANERSVACIVRTGGRDFSYLDRALLSLECQTHSNLHAIVVAYRNADAVSRSLSARDNGNLNVTVTPSADTGLRSTALWAGLNAVSSEFYGILDDDDTLLPDHVASCLATLDANPEIDLAYAGTILVHEDGNEMEPRSVMSFPHFVPEVFRQRNDICSNAWLARHATVQRAGPDPELIAGEDYYLLLRLYRGVNFAPTWRLTAEYRQRTSDKTHSRLSTDFDTSLDRIKRRLYFAPHSAFTMPSAPDLWSVLAKNDFVAGRILRQAIKRRYRRKGLQIYLTEIGRLPRRICRLPSILADGGIKGLVRRIENRGADEYARRARMSSFKSDR
jgi:hypothetical protein